jgi:hypothetical protein
MIEYGKLIALESIEEGLKWFYLGFFRAQQDAYCCESELFDMDNQFLENGYFPKQWLEIGQEFVNKGIKTIDPRSQKKAKQEALAALKDWRWFPSPQWMAYCAPAAKRGKPVRLKPQTEWPKMHALVIREQEQKLKNEEQQKLNNRRIFGFLPRLRPLHMLIGLGVCGISLYLLKKCFAKIA